MFIDSQMFLLQNDADIHMAKFQVIVTGFFLKKKGNRPSSHKTADFAVLGNVLCHIIQQ